MFSTSDTIVAIATPPGRGGIGVVRLSGPEAARVACALIGRAAPLRPRHATFARIIEPSKEACAPGDASERRRSGEGARRSVRALRRQPRAPRPPSRGGDEDPRNVLDQVIVTWFPAPHSYTGEDVVEIGAHGTPVLLQRIVELAMAAGARLAEPGEFTLRAFLNGRIDLVQAEAVADLIDAVTPLQARVAMDQLEGTLTSAIGRIDAALFDLTARLEASLDFPDEGFHFITRDQARDEIARITESMADLIAHGQTGRLVRDGRLVAIVGRPNVGKSSLFNALAGADRAIVTEVPGTTRDPLTEQLDILGFPITLVDTAGIRETTDVVEAEGVERAKQAQRVAAWKLVVLDGSAPLTDDDRRVMADSFPRLIVISKADLPRPWSTRELELPSEDVTEVSALAGTGLDELRRRLVTALTGRDEWRDPPRISNTRHLALMESAMTAARRASDAIAAGATEELVLVDLTASRQRLEEITGRRTTDDLLGHVFARFCVGK
jgi:tRNA modification GTPase